MAISKEAWLAQNPCKFAVGDRVRARGTSGVVTRIGAQMFIGRLTGRAYPDMYEHVVYMKGFSAPVSEFFPDEEEPAVSDSTDAAYASLDAARDSVLV